MRRSSSSRKVRDQSNQRKTKSNFISSCSREFLRLNDECADKIYDIRERSDFSREILLNSDGVAPRFYQMEADAVRKQNEKKMNFSTIDFLFKMKNRYELNNMKRKLDGIKQLRARLFK